MKQPTPAATQPAAAEPLDSVRQYIAALDRGDTKSADTCLAQSLTIIDELPPYLWQGNDAFQQWLAAAAANDRREGITGLELETGAPTRQEIDGEHAYLILPATLTLQQQGERRRTAAQWTFALTRLGADWKIAAMTWTAPRAEPVPPETRSPPP